MEEEEALKKQPVEEAKTAIPLKKSLSICPECKTENRLNAKFCKGCGFNMYLQAARVPLSSEIVQEETIKLTEEEVTRAEEEAMKRAEEEARRAEEEFLRQSEEELKRAEEEARKLAEEEARKAEEEFLRQSEEELKRAEEEARKLAEEEARKAEEEFLKQSEQEVNRRKEEKKKDINICTICNAENRINAKFCHNCGGILPAVIGNEGDSGSLKKNSTIIFNQSKATIKIAEDDLNQDNAKCPVCYSENRINARFCKSCGVNLQELTVFCANCRAQNRGIEKYCKSCGFSLYQEENVNTDTEEYIETTGHLFGTTYLKDDSGVSVGFDSMFM